MQSTADRICLAAVQAEVEYVAAQRELRRTQRELERTQRELERIARRKDDAQRACTAAQREFRDFIDKTSSDFLRAQREALQPAPPSTSEAPS